MTDTRSVARIIEDARRAQAGLPTRTEEILEKRRTAAQIRASRHKRTHGTIGGYMQHHRRKEESCIECKAAWRDYYREYMRAKARAKKEALDATSESKRTHNLHEVQA